MGGAHLHAADIDGYGPATLGVGHGDNITGRRYRPHSATKIRSRFVGPVPSSRYDLRRAVYRPRFVVMMITPLAPREPYTAVAPASFKTSMRAMSCGARLASIAPADPRAGMSSITSSGSSPATVPVRPWWPRIRSVKEPPRSGRTSKPGTRARNRSSTRATRVSASVGEIDVIAAVRLLLCCVPYPTETSSSGVGVGVGFASCRGAGPAQPTTSARASPQLSGITRGRRSFVPFIGGLLVEVWAARQGQSSPLLLRECHSPLVLDRKDETKGRLESALPASQPGVHSPLLISHVPSVAHLIRRPGSYPGRLTTIGAPVLFRLRRLE